MTKDHARKISTGIHRLYLACRQHGSRPRLVGIASSVHVVWQNAPELRKITHVQAAAFFARQQE